MPLKLAHDALPTDRFGASPPFRIGVEEELLLVHPDTYAIDNRADELLRRTRRFVKGEIVGEICDGVVELVTPVCGTAAEATGALGALRRQATRGGGPLLMGAGMHPLQPFGDVCHRVGDHYAAVLADARGILAQSTYCGVHVHVGMPDPEAAIAAYNGLRRWVPVLQALSANSPFWHGRDSGLASARTVRQHSLPRTGLPRAFSDWDDYSGAVGDLLRVSDADGVGAIWWDVRPHPGLGTVEVRIMDAQSSLADLEGLVALTHCLAYHEAVTAGGEHPSKELLDEATFRAVRDGIDATFSIGGPVRGVRDLALQALRISEGYAARMGCGASLRRVADLLAHGNGAARQRRAHARGGMRAVLELLVQETAALPADAAAPPQARTYPGAA